MGDFDHLIGKHVRWNVPDGVREAEIVGVYNCYEGLIANVRYPGSDETFKFHLDEPDITGKSPQII